MNCTYFYRYFSRRSDLPEGDVRMPFEVGACYEPLRCNIPRLDLTTNICTFYRHGQEFLELYKAVAAPSRQYGERLRRACARGEDGIIRVGHSYKYG